VNFFKIQDNYILSYMCLFDPCQQESGCAVCQTFSVCPNFDIITGNC